MKKAIVTGATGFIGKISRKRTCENRNVEVIAVVRRGTKKILIRSMLCR